MIRIALVVLGSLWGFLCLGPASWSCRADEPQPLHRIAPASPAELRELLHDDRQPLPVVSAHRGGAATGYPENCIATFERTLRHGFAMLEIDPRSTRDGRIAVHHDETLERTTTGIGRVRNSTLSSLRRLRLKDPDGHVTEHTMPSLDEVIEWARGKTVLVLDQKDVPALERARVVHELKAEAFVLLIVSNFQDVQAVHAQYRDQMMEVMIPSREKVRAFDELGVPWSHVIPFVGHVPPEDRELYADIHARGARCLIGTSRNLDRRYLTGEVTEMAALEPQYREFLQRGADVIETDIPVPLWPLLYRETQVPERLQRVLRIE